MFDMYGNCVFDDYGLAVHSYSLSATGIRMKEKHFAHREDAKQAMYKYMAKKNLMLVKVYDDKHFKTYICNNDVRFYINREDY